MIVKARNKRPKISFEFGLVEKEVDSGTTVQINLNNLFNTNNFTTIVKPISGTTIVKVSAYIYTITPTTTGTFDVLLEVTNVATTKILKSNKIKLISV